MDRKHLEQYVGKNIEIMLMPDGHKTSGVLLRCEDDHIALGEELWVYPMIWGVRPLSNEVVATPAPSPSLSVSNSGLSPVSTPVSEPEQTEQKDISGFDGELEKIFNRMRETLETFTLNSDYVRKFRPKGQNKIQSVIESILTKYQYAVKAHEDRPYSMRMREIVETAYHLWKNNKASIAASEIYAFALYLTGESEKSVKLYMRIHDFHGAFMAASSAASKILAAACIAVSENLTSDNFATFLKVEPPQLASILKWLIDNVIKDNRESEFNRAAALAWKILGFNEWANDKILFCDENVKALREWLDTRPNDEKIIADALKITSKESMLKQEEAIQKVDWTTQRFEGDFEFFNPNRDKLFGFIKCPILRKYGVPISSENSIFVHFNQIQDTQLRQKLLLGKKMHPSLRVTFKLGRNLLGPAAYEVREKNYDIDAVLKINMQSALAEEGVIDFFRRHDEIPFGKVRIKDGQLFTFNETNVSDPLLMVFLEYSPSAEGHPVRFTRSVLDNDKIQIHNVESAVPFPEDKIKAWQDEGLIEKAREKMNLDEEETEEIIEVQPEENEFDPEIQELLDRSYIPLEVYSPGEKTAPVEKTERKISPHNKNGVETFNELPKFLQDKILSINVAGKCSTEFLSDTFYRRGHYREVKANYLQLVSSFNSDDAALTNAERSERCFLIARYVYNFFALADETDIRLYSAADEDNIRIMAYKGLEYLIYDQLDGAKKNDENYDTARRYCLLRIAGELQTTRRIDNENTWLKIYIYSYFTNGLRFHAKTGKWSAQDVSLAGSSLLECNDFGKFFDGLLALAYVTEPSILYSTLRSLLNNLEYAAFLIEKLGISYNDGDALPEIQKAFQNAVDEYAKRKDIFVLDPEVKLSPEIFRILSVQSALIRLMKKELQYILKTPLENLDAALKRSTPILDTEEYQVSLAKTRRKYNPDAGLLDILPISVLGKIMGQYWGHFAHYFNDRPFLSYWKSRFDKLQWVRNPVFHAHPEYVKKEDIEEVQAICHELSECLANSGRN